MPVVHRFSRLRLPLVLLLASFFLLTCKTQGPGGASTAPSPAPPPAPPAPSRSGPDSFVPAAGVCRQGAGSTNRDRPIVCVDDSADAMTVNPDPVMVHEVMSTDRRTRPVLHWFTRSGAGDLRVEFRDPGCVTDIRCDGKGHCKAMVMPLDGAEQKRCKYDVNLTGHTTLDPDTIIVGCCG